MERTLNKMISILPFAFLVHNAEEVFAMTTFNQPSPSIISSVTDYQFAMAAGIFSLLGFALVYSKDYYPRQQQFMFTIAGFAGMIFLNVFSHVSSALYFHRYVPGMITALFINMPLTFYILKIIYQTQKITLSQLILTVLAGGLVGGILAYSLLRIVYEG